MVSAIMGRPNHHPIYNCDVEFRPSYSPVGFNSEYVTDPDTTPIKSVGGDKMDHFLKLFHSKHDEYLLDVETHMLQA